MSSAPAEDRPLAVLVIDDERPALDELGWERAAGESDLTSKLRGLLVTTVAVLGGDEIMASVKEHLGIGHNETTEDGRISPASPRSRVDFPQAFGPTITVIRAAGIVTDWSSTTSFPGVYPRARFSPDSVIRSLRSGCCAPVAR